MGIIDATTKAEIAAGRVGVVAIASFGGVVVPSLSEGGVNNDISLRAYEQLNLLSNIVNDTSVTFVEVGKYSGVLTKKFTVTVSNDGDAITRQINVITSAFVPNDDRNVENPK